MGVYGLLLLVALLVIIGLVFWIVKIIKLFRKGQTRRATIHAIVLLFLALFVCWEFRILPLSAEFKFKKQTEALTGKEFWCWNEFLYEEWGMRGEGFTFEIYRFNKEMANYFYAPPPAFFNDFPRADFGVSRCKKTPLPDSAFLSSMMAVYGNINKSTVKFDKPGVYKITCHEYCGVGHQNMQAEVIVNDPAAK